MKPKIDSTAAKLLADRILARRRLLHFVKLTHNNYLAGWVHDDICRRLERFSRKITEGKSPRLMILLPPRHGKACAVGTLVPTPTGFRTIESLRPGDEVFGRDGRPTKVVAVSPVWKDRELYEVVADDGASVVVDAEHEWTVRLCRKRPVFKTKTTKYLAERDSPRKPALMTYSAVEYPEADLPIHPYVLGVWLGDGCSAHATITQGPQDYEFIRTEVELCGYLTTDRATNGTFGIQGIQTALGDLGLLRSKHIPEIYLMASVAQRRALLQGLIDTDGYVAPDGQVEFCSTNEELARHTLQLVRSLGVKASLIQGDATLDGRFISRKYRVMFYMAGAARLPRKAARCRDNTRTPHRFLTFKPAGRGDTVCIQVEAEDNQYLVGDGYLLTHNSELASIRFPAWHLGHNPTHEIINVGYNLELPMKFSRKVRELMRDPQYKAIFPEVQLDPDSQSVEAWNTTKGGGFMAAGVGGGITGKGAHCLPAGTQVLTTDGQVDIAHLYRLKSKPLVQTPVGPRQILAMTRRETSEGLYVLRFASGATLQATGRHPIYLPDRGGYVSVEELYGEAQGSGGLDLRVVRAVVPTPAVRPQQVDPVGVDGVLLQQGVQSGAPRGEERQAVRDMRQAGGGGPQEPQREVLQRCLHPLQENPRAEDLPGVLRGVSAQVFTDGLLRGDLRKYGALDPYAWDGELELQGRQFLQLVVQPSSQARAGEGCAVRGLRSDTESPLPSHRPRPEKQPGGESGHAVPDVSHRPPQVCYDTLVVVEYVCSGGVEVYDIQVEEAGCFFADSVLVGNCLIIDDPIKNQEEADSILVRDKLWDWYQSTAYTRLAPGGGVLVIQTWWNEDDLAGRLQNAMRLDKDADQFEIIKYPALSTSYEYRDDSDPDNPGPIIRTDEPLENPPPHYTLLRPKDCCLHEARYPTEALERIRANLQPRIWSALYQQDPIPDEGTYFKKEYFRYQRQLPDPRGLSIYTAWDFAIGEKQTNDWTVGATILQDEIDQIYVLEIFRMKGDSFQIVEAMLDVAARWGTIPQTGYLIGAEDGQIWRAIEPLLKKRMAERRQYVPYEVLRPMTDKLARARPLQGRMQQGRVIFPEEASWRAQAEQELLRFPAGAHDDVVDALAWAVQLCMNKEPPRGYTVPQIRSWKDKLNELVNGVQNSGSYMSA